MAKQIGKLLLVASLLLTALTGSAVAGGWDLVTLDHIRYSATYRRIVLLESFNTEFQCTDRRNYLLSWAAGELGELRPGTERWHDVRALYNAYRECRCVWSP
jgi:hypothetical protein